MSSQHWSSALLNISYVHPISEPTLSLQLLLTWIIPNTCDFSSVSFLESLGWLHRQGFISHMQFWPCYRAYNYLCDGSWLHLLPISLISTLHVHWILQLHWSFFHCFCTKQFFLSLSLLLFSIHLSDIILWITSLRVFPDSLYWIKHPTCIIP